MPRAMASMRSAIVAAEKTTSMVSGVGCVSAMRHLFTRIGRDLRVPMGKPAARNIALATRPNSPHQSATILND